VSIFSSLNRQQKEAVGLLQIGTFLEYFDLMLYVHMAVLLNELFFPKTDPHTASLLTAFAFCSTYILRPFGAMLFGWIGDNIGRKHTVIITTMLMSLSCIIMANLPTYAEIGISAAWVVTICRMVQGLSSMGEVIGAIVYVSEITKPPVQYMAVSCITIATQVGGMVALGIAALVTSIELNWRIAFWAGAGIAVVGSVARIRLRETPEFTDMKLILQEKLKEHKNNPTLYLKTSKIRDELSKVPLKKMSWLAYFLVYCGWPLCLYLTFMSFNPLLKSMFNYSAENVIVHNFYLSIILFFAYSGWAVLSQKVHPLKILKERAKVLFIIMLLLPFCITHSTHQLQIFLIQALLLIFSISSTPADSIFVKHFPVFTRFTTSSVLFALSRAVTHIVTAFGLVHLTETFGAYGIWVIALPICIGFLWGVNHFEKLEKQKQHQVHTPHPLSPKLDEIKLAG